MDLAVWPWTKLSPDPDKKHQNLHQNSTALQTFYRLSVYAMSLFPGSRSNEHVHFKRLSLSMVRDLCNVLHSSITAYIEASNNPTPLHVVLLHPASLLPRSTLVLDTIAFSR